MVELLVAGSSIYEPFFPDATLNETLLDLRGLKCPLPALRTSRHLARMKPGRLIVLATDPMSVIDVPHAVTQAGGVLISQSSADGVSRFEIERSA